MEDMRRTIVLLFAVVHLCAGVYGQEMFGKRRIIASGLADPWSIVYGPEGSLWVTESKSYRVSRIDPASGRKRLLLDLAGRREFPRYDTLRVEGKSWPQGGLMGLALHPDFDRHPFVYLAYVFRDLGQNDFLAKVVRYTYDRKTDSLINEEMIDGAVPASNDHNGGRLAVAPEGGRFYLFYAVGDMGAGQFKNGGKPNHAQDSSRKEGKILRYLLEPDSSARGTEAWLPPDNPFGAGTRSAVFSVGHRNPQGLVWAHTRDFSLLFSCEHGPFSDDEINIIEKGGNYGHPLIIGYADGNYNGLAAAASDDPSLPGVWNTSYPLIEDELRAKDTLGSAFREPIYSFMPSPLSYLRDILEKVRASKEAEWDAVAPSSLAFYNHDALPEWRNSLLITTLKGGCVYRLPLTDDGRRVNGTPEKLFDERVRYRDITVSPDGSKLYLVTDRSAATSEPTSENPDQIDMRGCVIEYTLTAGDSR